MKPEEYQKHHCSLVFQWLEQAAGYQQQFQKGADNGQCYAVCC
jgi:hypothetical protein